MKDIFPRAVVALVMVFLACDVLTTGEFQPSGTQFSLNSNISVVAITGDPDLSDLGPVTIAFKATSRTSNSESAVLPAGLLLVRRNNQTQHLLLLKDQTVTADSAATKTLLGTFCCNQHRLIPDAGDTFDLGPTTDNTGLQQIVNLVRNKNISGYTDMAMVQRAVYLVTDSTGLTQAYIDSINVLPAATTH